MSEPDTERVERLVKILTDTMKTHAQWAVESGDAPADVFNDMTSAIAVAAAMWLTFHLGRASAFRLVPNVARQITATIGVLKEPPS